MSKRVTLTNQEIRVIRTVIASVKSDLPGRVGIGHTVANITAIDVLDEILNKLSPSEEETSNEK